ncbi:MAG: HD-GYP domain-containing protein [Candidatus Woesearchaeota archaeon]
MYHHENYDGSGYPKGLKANNIPLYARIVRIADVYDALTSERAYRSAYDKERALEIMLKEREKFDPKLFDIFLEINLGKIKK